MDEYIDKINDLEFEIRKINAENLEKSKGLEQKIKSKKDKISDLYK